MAVLVDGFTIVARVEGVKAYDPGGWDGFWGEFADDSACTDGFLMRVGFATRPAMRGWLERLAARGVADAVTLLEATARTPGQVMTPEEIVARQMRMTLTRDFALVYRLQRVRPHWVTLALGTVPGTDVVVAGAALAGAPPAGLTVPHGWTVERAVPERYEPEPGDELLPTWRELLAESSGERREEMLRWGPDAWLAFGSSLGLPKPFGWRVHPGGLVVEEERVERGPDGVERRVLHRWTKLPK